VVCEFSLTYDNKSNLKLITKYISSKQTILQQDIKTHSLSHKLSATV
jgi:hypothetical protein